MVIIKLITNIYSRFMHGDSEKDWLPYQFHILLEYKPHRTCRDDSSSPGPRVCGSSAIRYLEATPALSASLVRASALLCLTQGHVDQLATFHVRLDANDWLHGAGSNSSVTSHHTNIAFLFGPPIASIQGDKVFDSI